MAEYRSTGRELRKSPRGLIALLFVVILIAGAYYGFRWIHGGMHSLRNTEPETSSEAEIVVPDTETTPAAEEISYTTTEVSVSAVKNGMLILVNDTFMTEDPSEDIIAAHEKRTKALMVRNLNVQIRGEAMDAAGQMADAFAAATGHTDLLVMEAYRSREQQKKLYQKDAKNNALPGCSDYQTGYTLNFSLYNGGKFADYQPEGDYAWIAEHCAEYGFIRRFPPEKDVLTQAADRKEWAFRYVGQPHSMFIAQNDLCLEEYLDLLEEYPSDGTHLAETDASGQKYEVYYVSVDPNNPEETVKIPVPSSLPYTISGDNRHGLIVTVKLPEDAGAQDTTTTATDVTTTAQPS